MTRTYVHPVITEYQNAYRAYFGIEPPKVVRRSNESFVIHGEAGQSCPHTASEMKNITRALRQWKRERDAA